MNKPKDDESDVIRRAQAGDVAAFQRLVESHGERLFRSAMVLGGDRQWAEDLSQETLLEAWRSLPRFDGRCRFSTWLYGILRHRFLKGVRRQNLARPAKSGDVDQTASFAPSAALGLEMAEDAARVRQAIAALPEEQRLVVEMRFFAEASLEEVAAALGCPLGTVKSRLHYALENLRLMNLSVNLFAATRESQPRNP